MFKDYKNYIKPFHLEETCDYLLFRPLAFLALKPISKLSFVTPNSISYTALIIAIVSGYFLSIGTPSNFVIGGIGILIFIILDCCDGMLARKLSQTKAYSNPMGEIVDMFVDLLSTITFFVCLSLSMQKIPEWGALFWLPYISGVIIFIHATLFHFYKKQYGYHEAGNTQNLSEHLENFKKLKKEWKQKNIRAFDRFLIWAFLNFSKLEHQNARHSNIYDSALYIKENKKILPFWAFIAGTNHLFILSLSLILGKLEIFFFYSLIFSNIWMFITYAVQVLVNKKCRSEIKPLQGGV